MPLVEYRLFLVGMDKADNPACQIWVDIFSSSGGFNAVNNINHIFPSN